MRFLCSHSPRFVGIGFASLVRAHSFPCYPGGFGFLLLVWEENSLGIVVESTMGVQSMTGMALSRSIILLQANFTFILYQVLLQPKKMLEEESVGTKLIPKVHSEL